MGVNFVFFFFSLISVWFQKYFRSFMFLCPNLLEMGVNLLRFLGIWFIKATTEESVSLTKAKPHSLLKGIRLIMCPSDMTCKKLNTMLVYFQRNTKSYIQDIFPWLPACSGTSSI